MWIQLSLKLNILCRREDNHCFRMIWLLQLVKYQAILSINWNSTVCSWSQLTAALCTECLWTYRFSDLLFDLHYLMIIIISVLTQLLMSSIVLTLLNYSGLLHLFFCLLWIGTSSAYPEQGNWSVTEFRQSSLIHSRVYYQFWFPWRVITNRMFSQNRKKTSPLLQSYLTLKKSVWKVTKVQGHREWVSINAILSTLISIFLSTERQQNNFMLYLNRKMCNILAAAAIRT